MKNRRAFIKQLAAAGIATSIPSVIFSQKQSSQPITLIVRGDDMGKNYCRLQGFMHAHSEGVLTSASIMATSAYFEESVRYCKKNPSLAAGIHITLFDGTQRPVLSPEEIPSIVSPRGFFYEGVKDVANPNLEEMEKEIRAQVKKARLSGLHFVYLDSHRFVSEGGEKIIAKICQEEKLIYGDTDPLSEFGYKRIGLIPGEKFPNQVLPDGQVAYYSAPALTNEQEQSFFNALANLKPGRNITVCHPGWVDPNRASVTKLLCSPETKSIIKKNNIQLASYYDIWKEKFS